MIKKGLVCLIFYAFISCQGETSKNTVLKNDNHDTQISAIFDLKGFMQNEISKHSNSKNISKTLTINGASETKNIAVNDWQEELSVFINADINRPAWRDKYILKEGYLPQSGTFKRYEAIDDQLKIRTLAIGYDDNGAVETIFIESNEESAVTQSNQKLNYKVGNGYDIVSVQKNALSKTDTIKIEAKFQ